MRLPVSRLPLLFALASLGACGGAGDSTARTPSRARATDAAAQQQQTQAIAKPVTDLPFRAQALATFDEPWAMAFLPDGRLLVTEKAGTLKLFDPASKRSGDVAGVPKIAYGGQGGFADVALHPDFARNHAIYISYAEQGDGGLRGGAVARATLVADANGGGRLDDLKVIWRQVPKTTGEGQYALRLLFSPDGKFLYIASGERQKFTPAQDMASNLGKIVRLTPDGGVPADNPFAARGGTTAQVWSLGHRNPLGIAFDAQGRLWETEMGPRGGDELDLVQPKANYGWPVVSNGINYDGTPIPDHATQPQYVPPVLWWNPVIAPSSLLIYDGDVFPQWKGDAFITGLASQALVRVEFDGTTAKEAARYPMDHRLRDVVQGPDGALYLLEDGDGGRLLKLVPR